MILRYGKKLLGSAGKEYDYSLASLDPASRLALQKKTLTSRLGLGGEYLEEDLITEKDFAATSQPSLPTAPRIDTSAGQLSRRGSISSPSAYPANDLASALTPTDDASAMSKRQLNQLKRKNKLNAKNHASKVRVVDLSIRRPSTDVADAAAGGEPHAIKPEVKAEDSTSEFYDPNRVADDDDSKIVSEFKGAPVPDKSAFQTEAEAQGEEWPYERLCEFLTVDLFDPTWEARHGAAMALREVIRVHGAGAGRQTNKSRKENNVLNQRWLDDLACRLCCVLMLDRFGDYISDNVVALIRETSGQTLGALLIHLSSVSVHSVYRILYRMVMQEDLSLEFPIWQVCHGGMIGLRYVVAVRKDLLLKDDELIDGVVRAVMKGLGDFDDDVRAVSAATLSPVVKEFVTLRPNALEGLINIVWDCLSNLKDDLSASTGSVMDLLAKLCSFPEVLNAMKNNATVNPEQSFALLVPRLYPFLRHTITSVRSAVLRALLTFLGIEGKGATAWVDGRILRLVFQNLLVERNEAVLDLSLQVWDRLASYVSEKDAELFRAEFLPHVEDLMDLTLHPIGVSRHPIPMDLSQFIRPSGHSYLPRAASARKSSPASGSERGAKRRRKTEKKEEPSAHNVDGHMIQGDVDLVGADVLIRSKIHAAQAMGRAMSLWPTDQVVADFGDRMLSRIQSVFSTPPLTAAIVAEEYASHSGNSTALGSFLATHLHKVLEEERPASYRDLVSYTQIVRGQCQSLLNLFREAGGISQSKIPTIAVVVQGDAEAGPGAFSIANGAKIVEEDFERLKKALPPAQRIKALDALNDTKKQAVTAIEVARSAKEQRDVRIRAAAAGAIITMGDIPRKPSHVIKGLMDSVKKEENVELQRRSATAVANLIRQYAASGRRGPVDKVVSNLVKFCCVDTSETPEFQHNAALEDSILSLRKEEDRKDHPDAAVFEKEARDAKIMRRGAKEALEQLAQTFRGQLLEQVPMLRSLIEEPIKKALTSDLPPNIKDPDNPLGQELVDAFSTIRALVPKFDAKLHPFILETVPFVIKALQSTLSVIRYAAAKCLASVCSIVTIQGMTMLVERVLPSISNALDLRCRQGAIECVYRKLTLYLAMSCLC